MPSAKRRWLSAEVARALVCKNEILCLRLVWTAHICAVGPRTEWRCIVVNEKVWHSRNGWGEGHIVGDTGEGDVAEFVIAEVAKLPSIHLVGRVRLLLPRLRK